MKKLIIPLFVIVLFSACDAIYYKGHFYKPLYTKSFTQKPNVTPLKNIPSKSVDTLEQIEKKDSVINFNEIHIDSLKAKIYRHEIKYNNQYIYSREEVGLRSKAPKNNKIIGYVIEEKYKSLRYVLFGSILLYAIIAALMSIFAAIMLMYFLFGIDNN